MLVINPTNGRMFTVDDDRRIQELTTTGGYRPATPQEEARYFMELAERQAPTGENTVYFRTSDPGPNGYGMSRTHLQEELKGLGIFLTERYQGQKVGLLYHYPYGVAQMENDVRLIYTMFESDKLPAEWSEYCAMANQVMVPSKWCQDTFKRAGIDTTVVPLGYNDRLFTYHDRPVPMDHGQDFTFLHYNSYDVRKGFLEVFKAFSEEFKIGEPVKLVLKSNNQNPPIKFVPSQYPNIRTVLGALPEPELVSLLHSAHCFIYPSRGEGFGITPLEAMATGLPAIIPNAHGMTEYFHKDYMLEVEVESAIPAAYNQFKGVDVGDWQLSSVASLRRQMRYAFNHQAEMKELGQRASRYVRNWTYQKTAQQLADILKHWERVEVPKRPESKYLFVQQIT